MKPPLQAWNFCVESRRLERVGKSPAHRDDDGNDYDEDKPRSNTRFGRIDFPRLIRARRPEPATTGKQFG